MFPSMISSTKELTDRIAELEKSAKTVIGWLERSHTQPTGSKVIIRSLRRVLGEEVPEFQHECTECVFLGTDVVLNNVFDMYFCTGNHHATKVERCSMLVRWSDGHVASFELGKQAFELGDKYKYKHIPYAKALGLAYGRALARRLVPTK